MTTGQGQVQDTSADAQGQVTDNDDDSDNESDNQEADAETLRENLRQARRAERAAKRDLGRVSTELNTIKQSQLSELEKAQQERDEAKAQREAAEKRLRERDARDKFTEAARAAGAIRPDALFRLADDLEYDDEGQLVNEKAAIASLRKTYPELFGAAGGADGGSGRGTVPRTSVSDDIRRQLGRA